MSAQSDYTSEEWSALVRAPLLAGMSLTLADPGGPIEALKEVAATMKVMTSPDSQEELLVAVSQAAKSMMAERQNPIGDFRPEAAKAGEQILDELRRVDGILRAKATPEEAAAFRAWLGRAAQAAADAAKEGGFLGFGAVKVSEGEQGMLDQVRAALGGAGAASAAAAAAAPDTGVRAESAAGAESAAEDEPGDTEAEDEDELEGEAEGVPVVDPDLCTGCGICEDVCPEVFEIGADGLSHVIDEEACETAGCCQEAADQCPEDAISFE